MTIRNRHPTPRQIKHFGYDLAVKAVAWTENGICKNKNDPRFDHIRCTAIARSTGKRCRNIRTRGFDKCVFHGRRKHAPARIRYNKLQAKWVRKPWQPLDFFDVLTLIRTIDPAERARFEADVRPVIPDIDPDAAPVGVVARTYWRWRREVLQLGSQGREMWLHGTKKDIPRWLAGDGSRPW